MQPQLLLKKVRGFVHKRKYTALTQYNELVYFPHAIIERDAVIASTSAFIEKLIPMLAADPLSANLDSFIVDLVLLDSGEVKIIEINPFAEFAGSGLFSWCDWHRCLILRCCNLSLMCLVFWAGQNRRTLMY
jgi:hypothetical protein